MTTGEEILKRLDEIIALLRARDEVPFELQPGDAKIPARQKRMVKDLTPYDAILETWAEICPHLPQPQMPSPELKTKIRHFWANALKYGKWANVDPDAWVRGLFRLVADSDFLSGREKTARPGWVATLRWVMMPANFNKIIDGEFDNARKRTG